MPNIEKRILVDMSCTLIHHGHTRLLARARKLADEHSALLVVGLTSDEEVYLHKGYWPELAYEERKEVLEAIKYVDKVIAAPWLIDEEFLVKNNIDYLFHGSDNSNQINKDKLMVVPRTEGISSSDLRANVVESLMSKINQQKIMHTPGPAAIPSQNALCATPLFGRGDEEFSALDQRVMQGLAKLTGMDKVVRLQGAASLALEIALHNFVSGKVLVINTGFYCARLSLVLQNLQKRGQVQLLEIISADQFLNTALGELEQAKNSYDWIVSVYAETSNALLNDVPKLHKLKQLCSARLYLDSTASIGLEEQHHLADLIAFSSCKGLGAITGGAFIAYKDELEYREESSFYMNIHTHIDKKMTGPYHPMQALDRLLPMQDEIRARVSRTKKAFCEKFADRLILPPERQPLIGTRLRGELEDSNTEQRVVFYQPRTAVAGESVVCHFSEMHLPSHMPSQAYTHLSLKQ